MCHFLDKTIIEFIPSKDFALFKFWKYIHMDIYMYVYIYIYIYISLSIYIIYIYR